MKKILAAIAMLLAVVPFVGAKALNETTNYYSYKKGQIVNFYRNQESEAKHQGEANETIILDDKGANDKFVKVWLWGEYVANNKDPYKYIFTSATPKSYTFKQLKNTQYSDAYDLLINRFGTAGFQDGTEEDEYNYFYKFTDDTKGIDLISLEELQDVFEVVEVTGADTTYGKKYRIKDKTLLNRDETTITLYKEFEKFTKIADATQLKGVKNGIWTSTVASKSETTGDVYVYAIKFTFDANEEITDVTIEPVKACGDPYSRPAEEVYAFVPTAYANKTADCHQETTKDESKEYCYKCKEVDGTFKWYILKDNDSKIGDVCELEQDATKCNPKTGSKSHLLEFSIVAALCAISLLVVRRKDLFRTI